MQLINKVLLSLFQSIRNLNMKTVLSEMTIEQRAFDLFIKEPTRTIDNVAECLLIEFPFMSSEEAFQFAFEANESIDQP